jgi:hypothetical protein
VGSTRYRYQIRNLKMTTATATKTTKNARSKNARSKKVSTPVAAVSPQVVTPEVVVPRVVAEVIAPVAEVIAPVAEVIAPVAEVIAPVAAPEAKLDFVGGVAQIFNSDGLVTTMDAGAKASSECRHLELASLRPHVAAPLGSSPEVVAALLTAREARMLDRPKIQRLLAAKAKA